MRRKTRYTVADDSAGQRIRALMLIIRHQLSEPTPDAYREELHQEAMRCFRMTLAELEAEFCGPGQSVARHNAIAAALNSRRPRLPEGERDHVHVSDYQPLDRA